MEAIEGAVCAHHPATPATGVCGRCGDYACRACWDDLNARCERCVEAVGETRYYVVPPWRAAWMLFVSVGVYPLYWHYKQWASIKRADASDIWPVARAIFAGFTFFSLQGDINTQSAFREKPPLPAAGPVIFLAGGALSRLPDPFGLISNLTQFAMLPAVSRIYELASPEQREQVAGMHTRHWVVTVIGLIAWVLVIVGLILPEAGGDPYGAGGAGLY